MIDDVLWEGECLDYLSNKAAARSDVLPRRVDVPHKTPLSSPPPLPNGLATIGLLMQI